MRDDPFPGEPNEPGGPSGTPPGGTLTPTPPASLALIAVVSGLLGFGLRALAQPLVSWVLPISITVVAVVVGGAAWATWRQVQVRRERLLAHQAVNRFVLGRASAYVGAVVCGAYLGYAASWIGADDYTLAGQRMLRSLVAGVAGLVVAVAGLLLERACRVRAGRSGP